MLRRLAALHPASAASQSSQCEVFNQAKCFNREAIFVFSCLLQSIESSSRSIYLQTRQKNVNLTASEDIKFIHSLKQSKKYTSGNARRLTVRTDDDFLVSDRAMVKNKREFDGSN